MIIKCPTCGRIIGDTTTSIDARINCKRCGQQEIHVRVANFDNYLIGHKATEEQNDKSE